MFSTYDYGSTENERLHRIFVCGKNNFIFLQTYNIKNTLKYQDKN